MQEGEEELLRRGERAENKIIVLHAALERIRSNIFAMTHEEIRNLLNAALAELEK